MGSIPIRGSPAPSQRNSMPRPRRGSASRDDRHRPDRASERPAPESENRAPHTSPRADSGLRLKETRQLFPSIVSDRRDDAHPRDDHPPHDRLASSHFVFEASRQNPTCIVALGRPGPDVAPCFKRPTLVFRAIDNLVVGRKPRIRDAEHRALTHHPLDVDVVDDPANVAAALDRKTSARRDQGPAPAVTARPAKKKPTVCQARQGQGSPASPDPLKWRPKNQRGPV